MKSIRTVDAAAAVNRKAVRERLRRVKKTDAVLSGRKDKEGSSAGMSDKIIEEPEMLMGYQWLLVVAKCPGNSRVKGGVPCMVTHLFA